MYWLTSVAAALVVARFLDDYYFTDSARSRIRGTFDAVAGSLEPIVLDEVATAQGLKEIAELLLKGAASVASLVLIVFGLNYFWADYIGAQNVFQAAISVGWREYDAVTSHFTSGGWRAALQMSVDRVAGSDVPLWLWAGTVTAVVAGVRLIVYAAVRINLLAQLMAVIPFDLSILGAKHVFKMSADPRRSPFTYIAALIGVLIAIAKWYGGNS